MNTQRMEPMAGLVTLVTLLMVVALGGCATPAGELFPAAADDPVWPIGPEPPRVRYVGQLAGSDDLKPAVSMGKALGKALFGKKPPETMLSPYAVCTDGGERLFVADSNGRVLHVLDMATRQYQRWRPGGAQTRFGHPTGVAYDPAGRLYVADAADACIHVFDTRGAYLGRIGSGVLSRPAGVAFDPRTQRLFVADVTVHQVVVLSSNGTPLMRIGQRGVGPGQFNYPTNVALDGQGRLYVSDSLNFRVQQFDPEMRFARQIGSQGDQPGYFAHPKGLAVDSADHLYVVDASFEAVQVFNAEGQLLMDFGSEGRGRGEFWLPSGIFIDAADRIWVADTYNRRVQVFDYLPEDRP